MYLPIGANVLVPVSEIIAIIAYQGSQDISKKNKLFLEDRMNNGKMVDMANFPIEKVKSLLVMEHNRVYLSLVSPQTLLKRCKKFGLSEGLKKIDR